MRKSLSISWGKVVEALRQTRVQNRAVYTTSVVQNTSLLVNHRVFPGFSSAFPQPKMRVFNLFGTSFSPQSTTPITTINSLINNYLYVVERSLT
jgi:hypothetical protein